MPGFFKKAMFERKTALLKLDVLYCIMKCVLILQLEINISLNGNSEISYDVIILYKILLLPFKDISSCKIETYFIIQ